MNCSVVEAYMRVSMRHSFKCDRMVKKSVSVVLALLKASTVSRSFLEFEAL
jgi:hypothetical protein